MPHSKTFPAQSRNENGEGSIVYWLQQDADRNSNYWLAERAGYEDGRWPDGPQWGEPSVSGTWLWGRGFTARKHHQKGYLQGQADRKKIDEALKIADEDELLAALSARKTDPYGRESGAAD
jgi:hypothetical protein